MSNDIGSIKSGVSPIAASGSVRPSERNVSAEAQREQRTARDETGRVRDDAAEIDQVVSDLNSLVSDLHRELQFSVDRDSGETVVKVVDRETDEVLRQIPSEDVMRLRKRLQEAAGVIFQDSA